MNLGLSRSDLSSVGPVSAKNTLKLLPFGKHKRQKVVVGDDGGVVTCFQTRRGEVQTVYKTGGSSSEVSALALGGAAGAKDKVFVSTGQAIKGISRKGKEFFSFQTNLSEKIRSMAVEGTRIWTGGEFVYTLYDNGAEAAYMMCEDRISSLCVERILRGDDYDGVLGCADRRIRVVDPSGKVSVETTVGGDVTSLMRYDQSVQGYTYDGERKIEAESAPLLMYGTGNGEIGQILVHRQPGQPSLACKFRKNRPSLIFPFAGFE